MSSHMKQTGFSVAFLVAVHLASATTAHATSITVSTGNTTSGFTNGQTVTSAAMLAAQAGEPSPFNAACGSDAVSVMIGQFDNYVSIPMKTRCYGSIAFQGRISGNQLSGTLNHRCSEGNEYVPATGVDAPASGSASTSHIQLTTTATSSGSGCALPNATIELSR